MTLLHITNDYSGSTVYKNLIRELDNLGIQQIVYNPVREQSRVGKNEVEFKTKDSKIIYRPILNYTSDRLFYPLKIRKVLRDIENQVDLTQVDIIHAHTWYSDGGVAYELSKRFNIPFSITIRNTDLNLFQKKMIYLRPYGRKIIQAAKHVFLISASYEKRVLAQGSLQGIKEVLENKLRIISNGVDPYWIAHPVVEKQVKTEAICNILYVGRFSKGKNVVALQAAVKLLKQEENIAVKLHLVGGGGKAEKQVLEQVTQHPELFEYHGKIYDKEKLVSIFQTCDIFAMPSKHETFGLVYVEAMLNGLPILYTENEGIDGFYEEPIGEKVKNFTPEEIKVKLLKLYKNYESYALPLEKIKYNHDWRIIAKAYEKCYERMLL